MVDLTQMEVGREYTLGEIPGFSSEDAAATVTEPVASMKRAFIRSLCDAVREKTVAAVYLHAPTGARYDDLQDIPDTYGEPVAHTGLDDIRVLFWRVA